MAQASSGDDAGHCLRSALSARPHGLAGLCSSSARIIGFNRFEKKRKGDTSNEARRGTFLKWVDNVFRQRLTPGVPCHTMRKCFRSVTGGSTCPASGNRCVSRHS